MIQDIIEEIKKVNTMVDLHSINGGLMLEQYKSMRENLFIELESEIEKLKELGLLNNKRLLEVFLLSSYEQRLDILRGLMDSDGYYNSKRKRFSISTTRLNQVNFSVELLSSLGIKTTIISYNKTINKTPVPAEYATNP